MTTPSLFSSLATAETRLPPGAPIRRLLVQSLNAAPFAKSMGRLRESFLTLHVGTAYQSYGLQLLSPLGRALLAANLAEEVGLDPREASAWLEDLAFAMVEDFHILRMVDGEPDWNIFEWELLSSIARRVFCGQADESRSLCLDVWPSWLTAELRNLKHQILSKTATNSIELSTEVCEELLKVRGLGEKSVALILRAVSETGQILLNDPMCVLGWRICYFAKANNLEAWELLVRHETDESQASAQKLAGLVALLSPNSAELVGKMPDRPVSLKDLSGVLNSPQQVPVDEKLFRQWMHLPLERRDCEKNLEQLIKDGCHSGLLFRVSDKPRNRKRATEKIGLTTLALRVLQPYQKDIDMLRLKNSV